MKYRAIAALLTLVMLISAFSFTVASATDLVDTSSRFTDVIDGKWYKSAVDYAVTHGLFSGMSETTFEPDTPMSRAMFVTVLSRIENIVVLNNISTKFSDVPLGKWYTGAVRWASDNGIVYGITDTEFMPDASITREQMCTMLIRYANYKSITLGKNLQKQAFSDDATIAGWAKDAVYSCQQAGIVSGMSPTTFVPKATATRAQVARILYVFHDEYINIESQPPAQETPPEELPFRPEYSYGSGILVSKERQPNRSVLPSFDIDKTGFVKGGTKLSYLNGVKLHFFTSDLCALWSYRDDNGKWISEWDWFKSLKDEIGLEIKYTVKAHANSINSSLQYMTAGKQLDVICTSEQTLASALCISRPLDELINITDYGSSPAISYNIMNAYKWGGSRRAVSPIGDVEVLWYNQTMTQEMGLADPHTLWEGKRWTLDEYESYMLSIPKKNKNDEALVAFTSSPSLMPEKWAVAGDGNTVITDTKAPVPTFINGWESQKTQSALQFIADVNSQVNFSFTGAREEYEGLYLGKTMMASSVYPFSYMDTDYSKHIQIQWVPYPKAADGSLHTVMSRGNVMMLPRITAKESSVNAALKFMELWASRYSESIFDSLYYTEYYSFNYNQRKQYYDYAMGATVSSGLFIQSNATREIALAMSGKSDESVMDIISRNRAVINQAIVNALKYGNT